ncbi:MAG: hypothetical protein HC913_22235 [Microscillaceae bacterium]|nr:hypothetical protein [Microscillaceae bacterium]
MRKNFEPIYFPAFVADLQAQGIEISVRWDCGGDETICTPHYNSHNFYQINRWVQESRESEASREKLMALFPGQENLKARSPWLGQLQNFDESLSMRIIDELSLPNAGEHYHRGEGQLKALDDQKIVLLYNSHEYYYDSTKDTFHFEGPDPLQIKEHLYRLAFEFWGEVNFNELQQTELRIHFSLQIHEGDEMPIGEADWQPYEAFFQVKMSKTYRKHFLNGLNQRSLADVYFEGNMRPDGTYEVRANRNYRIGTQHQNKEVVLYPLEID